MAVLSLTASNVHLIRAIYSITLPCAVGVTKGQTLAIDEDSGRWELGTDDVVHAISLGNAAIGQTVTGLVIGELEIGDVLGNEFGKPVYSADTAGAISLAAADATANTIIGLTMPASNGIDVNGFPNTRPILYVNIPLRASAAN